MMYSASFGSIRSKIVDRLDSVERSLHIAMAWFTNDVLYRIVLNKAGSGVKIELLLSDSESNFRPGYCLDFEALQRKKVKVSVVCSNNGYNFMHHKFAVLDEKAVITGSYNWSNNAHSNFENILILEDERIARDYLLQFGEFYKRDVTKLLQQFKMQNEANAPFTEQQADSYMFQLAREFNQAVEQTMAEAELLHIGLRLDILKSLIKKYTAVGAARKLSNDPEQSGFIRLVSVNRADLTFEYLTATSRFAPLFDKSTIKHAKQKLFPYLGEAVNTL